MNTHTLRIEMNLAPEALERVLRVTRHRGFRICHMNLDQGEAHSTMAVTVASDRPIIQLTRQLDKLYDVTQCQLQAPRGAAVANA